MGAEGGEPAVLSTTLLITLWISFWGNQVVTLCSTGHNRCMTRLTKFVETCGACENASHPANYDWFNIIYLGFFDDPDHAQHDYFCDACGSEFDESEVDYWNSMEVLA